MMKRLNAAGEACMTRKRLIVQIRLAIFGFEKSFAVVHSHPMLTILHTRRMIWKNCKFLIENRRLRFYDCFDACINLSPRYASVSEPAYSSQS